MHAIDQPTVAVPRQRLGAGLAAALVSAASFGLSGALAKSLLEIGWSPAAVVLVRIGGAFAVLLIPCLLSLRGRALPSASQARRMIGYGVVAIAGAQLCYASAVQYLSVGVALLLEYSAPVLLIGWYWLRHGERPSRAVLLGAGVAMAGLVLVLDVLHGLRLHPVGVLYGLGAAVCLCGYFLLSADESGEPTSPLTLTTVGTGVGALLLLATGLLGLTPLRFGFGEPTLAGVQVSWLVPVLVLVLVAAALAYLTGIVAVRRLGSSAASFVALSEVIFAVAFAAVLVGQHPGGWQLAGGVLVLVGIAIVQRRVEPAGRAT